MCGIEEGVMALFLVAVGYRDWRTKQISCLTLFVMAVLVIVLRVTMVEDTIWSTLGGVAVGMGFFFISRYSRESVGYGDSWLILLLGVFLGGKTLVEVVLVAAFLASLFSIVYGIKCGWNKKRTIPFVPFLAAGYIGVMLL